MTQTKQPRGPRRIEPWPLIVVGFLLLNVGICTVTIVAATRNPAIIEPNYYDKALRWDVLREIEDVASTAQLSINFNETPGVILLELLDKSGQVMRLESVSADALHESMPEIQLPLALKKIREGLYVSSTPLTKPGVWSVVATVTLDDSIEPFTFTSEVTIAP